MGLPGGENDMILAEQGSERQLTLRALFQVKENIELDQTSKVPATPALPGWT